MNHKVTEGPKESVKMALDAGCDLNCGCTYAYIMAALKKGLITEEQITRSCVRLYTTRFLLGLFDGSEYDSIPYEVVECEGHRKLAVTAAEKGIVLLKNDGILPLDKSRIKTIGVIGPNANSRRVLSGNYHGTSSHYVTVLDGIQKEAGETCRVLYSEGCHLYKDKTEPLAWPDDRISEAIITAKHSDLVVLVLGLDETVEGEEPDEGNAGQAGDKESLELPLCQQKLLEAVATAGKPVVTVLMSGSAMDLRYADQHTNAVLEAWYPGAEGGTALADILFGKVSPSGKLPVTFYYDTDDLPEFTDYSMKGRTYRYMERKAQFPFGFGLTYSNVTVDKAGVKTCGQKVNVEVEVQNNGAYDTEDVVQIYVKNIDSKNAIPNPMLAGFQRIFLKAGECRKIEIPIWEKAFTVVDEMGKRMEEGKKFEIYAGCSQPDEKSKELTGIMPVRIIWEK